MTPDDSTILRELVDGVGVTFPPAQAAAARTRARRRQRRRQGLGTTAVVVVVATTVGLGLGLGAGQGTHSHRVALEVTPSASAAPVVDRATDGLTGSLCDSPKATPPDRYLDWPCATPEPGVQKTLIDGYFANLNDIWTGATAPRVRLLIDDPVSGHRVLELWDDDHPATGTIVEVQDRGSATYTLGPSGDPALVAEKRVQAVFTRVSDVVSAQLEPTGVVLPLHNGFALVPDKDYAGVTSVVGLDASGRTQPGWTSPWSEPADPPAACDGQSTFGMCSRSYTAAALPPVADLCQSPTGAAPPHYLDWPCPSAVDDTTATRVAYGVDLVTSTHRGLSQPRVRLLADTRHSGSPADESGSDVTVIEVWDAADHGPAVTAVVIDDPRHPGTYAPEGDSPPDAGNPAVVLSGGYSGADRLVFVRSDVRGVVLHADGHTVASSVDGGIADLHLTGLGEPQPGWSVVGLAADGSQLAAVPWSESYVDPCDGVSTSTCSVIGAEPSFPSPTDGP